MAAIAADDAGFEHAGSYFDALDAAAMDTVRTVLDHPEDPDAGAVALREAAGWVERRYGAGAMRDLAETLATYVAEALLLLAAAQGVQPREVLDTFAHDVPPPQTGSA